MFDRRRFFLKSSAATAGVGTLCGSVGAADIADAPATAGGYNYRLPGLKKGSRLLFQGDSITDMKWGRNQQVTN